MRKRSISAALTAFILTFGVLMAMGATALTDLRIGRVLFGDTYAAVTASEPLERPSEESIARWFPARWRILLWLPQTIVEQVEKFLPIE